MTMCTINNDLTKKNQSIFDGQKLSKNEFKKQIMMPLAIHSRKVTLKFTTSGSGCLWKNCGKVHDLIIIYVCLKPSCKSNGSLR